MGCLDFCTLSADQFGPAYQRWEDHPAREEWEPIQDLGAGSFSQVVLAQHRTTGEFAALKVVFLDNPGVDPETIHLLTQEGELLLHLKHPNLVACTGVVKSARAHVLVLEFLRGCNILDGLYRLSAVYSERDAAGVFGQLAAVVGYLHSKGIIHRDIKPENVVFAKEMNPDKFEIHGAKHECGGQRNRSSPPIIKLVDLGMALRYDAGQPDHGALGSAGFVAPEIIVGGDHTPAMDVFSMGVLLFIMLVGRKPFNIEDCEKLRYGRMTLAEAPGLKDPRWLDLSPDAKQLLMGMLSFDPKRRLTAHQIIAHEWVATGGGRALRLLGPDVALGAATVAEMRRLRFICNGVVALNRAAQATAMHGGKAGNKKSRLAGSIRNQAAYLDELRRMQRREASTRGGGRSLRGLARALTAASFKTVHDTGGGSVHLVSHPVSQFVERSVHQSIITPVAGLKRSGTALLLSELTLDPSMHMHSGKSGGSVPNGALRRSATQSSFVPPPAYFENQEPDVNRETSGLGLLCSSVRQYVDVSIRGGRGGSQSRASGVDMSVHEEMKSPNDSKMVIEPAEGGEILRVVRVRRSEDGNETAQRKSLDNGAASHARRRVHSVRPLE